MENSNSKLSVTKCSHHNRAELCTSRPPYRQGKKLTAIKVDHQRWIATLNEESQHLLIRGVPALNLQTELKHLCLRYGDVKFVNLVPKYAEDEESFTEVYHVLYAKIQSARFSKHMLDDRSFYGGVLHVCYAPELENLNETKQKLLQRKRDVLRRINQLKPNQMVSTSQDSDDSILGPRIHSCVQNSNETARGRFVHAAGVIGQQFIPNMPARVPNTRSSSNVTSVASTRIGPRLIQSRISSIRNDNTRYSSQNSAVTSCSGASTESTSSQPTKAEVTATRPKPTPDKFLPSSVKRIRFN